MIPFDRLIKLTYFVHRLRYPFGMEDEIFYIDNLSPSPPSSKSTYRRLTGEIDVWLAGAIFLRALLILVICQ